MSPSSPRKLLAVQNVKSIIGTWIFTLLWCGISFPVLWAFAFKSKQLGGAIVGGLFSLFGLVMLFASVKMTLEYIKYGRVHLILEGEPPAVGGSLSATIQLSADALAAGKVSAELACVQVAWSQGSGGDSPSRGQHDAWTRKQEFPVRRGAAGGYSTLRFDIPADQPASDMPGESPPDVMLEAGRPAGVETGRSYYRWELRVNADVPGIDLDRTFKLQVSPAKQAADARPGVAPVTAPQINPVISAEIEQRLDARRADERKLNKVCTLVGFVPIVAPFAIWGLAVGLAGCPLSWSSDSPPNCEFAGINWGPLRSRAFDLMFFAVPAGVAGAAVLFFVGQLWLDRVHKTDRTGGRAGLAIGLVVLGFFLYHAWQFTRPFRSPQPVASQVQHPATAGKDASQVQQPAAAGKDASNVERGFRAQYVKVTGKDFTAEAHGAELRVRIGEVRLETTGKLASTRYTSFGISLYQGRQDLGAVWNQEIRGTLTAAEPSATLSNQVFVVSGAGARCAKGDCTVRLLLGVETSPNTSYGENTDFAALPISATRDVALPEAEPSRYWDTYFARAMTAMNQGRLDEAGRLFDETLAFIVKTHGADYPASALVIFRKASLHEKQKNRERQEGELLRALEILEKHPDAEVKKALGGGGSWLDKEMLARHIGDYYWEARRYDRGFEFYDRAYRYAPEIQTSDYDRNLKIAFSSAGRMVTACSLGKWDIADSAMAELKKRTVKVETESRKQLDTGYAPGSRAWPPASAELLRVADRFRYRAVL